MLSTLKSLDGLKIDDRLRKIATGGVNAIGRRLQRLEEQVKPRVNERGETPADVIRERRRRRLKAAGLPCGERPRENVAGARSRSEIMRRARQKARVSRNS